MLSWVEHEKSFITSGPGPLWSLSPILEALLMSTSNICFYGGIMKIILELLSPNIPLNYDYPLNHQFFTLTFSGQISAVEKLMIIFFPENRLWHFIQMVSSEHNF